ncbi:extensin family protein [Rhizobium sp. ARZ01]|uniref:extensin-like domain-containing protein n=1 Tax=Rhizobium sp. ARZ01 TaxID=2769313 RepID=UPI0032B208DC
MPVARPVQKNVKPDNAAPPAEELRKEELQPPPPPLMEERATVVDACIAELRSAGAVVKVTERIDPKNGCGIARPVTVSRLTPDIEIVPEATLRCETALQLQRWTREAIVPATKAAMPDKRLVGLDQASAYVCRNRNGAPNGKISEHAFGNAIDIAAFAFSDGSQLAIAPREEDASTEGALQRAAVATACLYFTTVLDPGSDAAHETHLHLDVKKRANGYRYCW